MGLLSLRKFETTILKEKTSSDDVQVPVEAGSVTVYYQGITVRAPVTVSNASDVSVWVFNVAKFKVGDLVSVGIAPPSMIVTEITDATHVRLQATGGSSVPLSTNNRLLITNRMPTIYSEQTGTTATTNPVVTNAVGYVSFYVKEPMFDWKVSGTGITSIHYQNGESGYPTQDVYNVNEFPTVQDAFDFLPSGSRIYFPSRDGPYRPPTRGGWIIHKSFEIFGDGNHSSLEGSYFLTFDGHKDACIMTFKRDQALDHHSGRNTYIHDIMFGGSYFGTDHDGVGDLIRLDNTDMNPVNIMGGFRMERVFLGYPGRSSVRTLGNNYIVNFGMKDVNTFGAKGDIAMKLSVITFADLNNVSFNDCWSTNLFVTCGNGSRLKINAEGAPKAGAITDPENQAALVLWECMDTVVEGGNMEQFNAYNVGAHGILMIGCRGCVVQCNEIDANAAVPPFTNWYDTAPGSAGIYIRSGTGEVQHANPKGNFIGPNMGYGAEFAVKIKDEGANTCRNNIIMPQATIFTNNIARWAVSVPENSANFVYVVNQDGVNGPTDMVGIKLPPVPAAVGIAGITDSTVRQKGLVIYDDTDDKLKFWDGAVWRVVTSA